MKLWRQVELVYSSMRRQDCAERALVLESAGLPSQITRYGEGFALVVDASHAATARRELEAYEDEFREPVEEEKVVPSMRGGGSQGVMVYVSVLVATAIMVQWNVFGKNWFDLGMAKAELIRVGEWWRCVTALTLHADVPHLAGNVFFGGAIGLLAGRMIGSGLGWLSILLAGACGNYLNAWVNEATHQSIGASTAVFAALGMMSACAWGRRQHVRLVKLYRWAPIIGGVVLLSFLGTGGVRTDVAAHVAGFLCGLLAGAVYGTWPERFEFSANTQAKLGGAAVAIVVTAWALALWI